MKYLKLFEDYKNMEDIEDVLLPFIDDGICTVPQDTISSHFKEFYFNTDKDATIATERLNKFNISNYLQYKQVICWYSSEIYEFVMSNLSGCDKIGSNPSDFGLWDAEDFSILGENDDNIVLWKKNGRTKHIHYTYEDEESQEFYSIQDENYSSVTFVNKYQLNLAQTSILIEYILYKNFGIDKHCRFYFTNLDFLKNTNYRKNF